MNALPPTPGEGETEAQIDEEFEEDDKTRVLGLWAVVCRRCASASRTHGNNQSFPSLGASPSFPRAAALAFALGNGGLFGGSAGSFGLTRFASGSGDASERDPSLGSVA